MGNRIHWGRGFFRFWVFASLLWVTAVLVFSWSDIVRPKVPPHVFIGRDGNVAWSEFSAQARAARELKTRGRYVEVKVEGAPNITYLGPDAGDLPDTMEEKVPLILGFYQMQVSMKRSSAIWQTIWLGLIAPAIVLLMGLLTAWVLRGFRDSRNTDAT